METISKLNEAARAGDIGLLNQLSRSDPLILRTAAISSVPGASPLEIACLAGHAAFMKELLKHDDVKLLFLRCLNKEGMSPLHIAAAIGDVEIVKELLKVDMGLCLLKGREARIPLHIVAVKGQVEVVKELLRANGDSVGNTTSRGETALHLAVKNYQFGVLCVLMEHIKSCNKVDVLNKKDELGNTILHLAAAKRQHEVVNLVLKIMPTEIISGVEVNSLNSMGYTALDLLLLLPSEAGDREIEEMIRGAKGSRARDIHVNNDQNQGTIIHNGRIQLAPPEASVEFFQYDAERDSPGTVRDVLLLIFTLITTATFQAGLSPPSFKISAYWHRRHWIFSLFYDFLSSSRLRYISPSYLFMWFNTSAFFLSLYMIFILTKGFPLVWPCRVCMVLLCLTYLTFTVCSHPLLFWAIPLVLTGVIIAAIANQLS